MLTQEGIIGWAQKIAECFHVEGMDFPGQIMSGIGCIQEGHAGSPEEIREWMSGNICRCGCYVKIVKAVEQAAQGK